MSVPVGLLEREVLADHARRRVGAAALTALAQPRSIAQRTNPVCGDRVTVGLHLTPDGSIQLAWEGRGCLISQASASMLAEAVAANAPLGAGGLRALLDEFGAMMTGREAPADDRLGDALLLSGVRRVPGRIACACQAWGVARDALDALEAEGSESIPAQPTERS